MHLGPWQDRRGRLGKLAENNPDVAVSGLDAYNQLRLAFSAAEQRRAPLFDLGPTAATVGERWHGSSPPGYWKRSAISTSIPIFGSIMSQTFVDYISS